MGTIEQIKKDLNEALKAKDNFKANTLRYILASIHNAQIEKGKGDDLSQEELAELIQKQAKQRRESIEAYSKGDRPDLVEKEERELGIIKKYLPEQLGEDEIGKMADDVISKIGASGPQDVGRVMGELMPKLKGKAEGEVVSKIVREKLS